MNHPNNKSNELSISSIQIKLNTFYPPNINEALNPVLEKRTKSEGKRM